MGMAASQARYLTLSARKSNVEYEGQQINQARTSLANQSANLFNQMLDMKVPTPPSKTEFTTIQYSFTDGINTEVLSNYYQLGNKDSDYNYVVTTYHNEKVYTGSRKKMNDPQVQAAYTNTYSYAKDSVDNNQTKAVTRAIGPTSPESLGEKTYLIQTSDGKTNVFRPINVNDQIEKAQADAILGAIQDPTVKGDNLVEKADIASFSACDADDLEDLKILFGDDTITDATKYYKKDGVYITKAEFEASPAADVNDAKSFEAPDYSQVYTDGKTFVTKDSLDEAVTIYEDNVANGTHNPNNIKFMSTTATPDTSSIVYTRVGNCNLSELKPEDFIRNADLAAEIDQIIKDMKGANGDTIAAENLSKCFEVDPDTGETVYKGGIYEFTMGGVKYYTTRADLEASLPTSIVDNGIDVQQQKLRYYNAIYVDTRVEDTQKALLETDGAGRFKSMRLENDNIVYTLNAEETTDDDAYNDAMNRYYYENAEYEKKIADINAKTEIIHAQDRTLELRLEQLQTEQSALQNEMEAVKKVVDKHVEQGFKTFGG